MKYNGKCIDILEEIKRARPKVKKYKFLSISSNATSLDIPTGNEIIRIYLNLELKNDSSIIKFGINDKWKIVVYKVI